MNYVVTIQPKPVTFVVNTMSGPDVAEEQARQRFRAMLLSGELPIHEVDHSPAEIEAE